MAEHSTPRRITDQEWQDNKDVINELYMVQCYTIDQLSLIMKDEHGFMASIQQYRRKIKKWGYTKKNRKDEYMGISHGLKRRRANADEVDVYQNGSLICAKKLKKQLPRHDLPTLLDRNEIQTPTGVLFRRRDSPSVMVSPPRHLPWFDFLDRFQQLASVVSWRPPLYECHSPYPSSVTNIARQETVIQLLLGGQTLAKMHRSNLEDHGQTKVVKGMITKVAPFIVERHPGDLETTICQLLSTQHAFTFTILATSHVVYLASNQLLKSLFLGRYCNWIRESRTEVILAAVLKIDSLNVDVLKRRLLKYAVEEDQSWLFRIVFPMVKDPKCFSLDVFDSLRSRCISILSRSRTQMLKTLIRAGVSMLGCQYLTCHERHCYIHPSILDKVAQGLSTEDECKEFNEILDVLIATQTYLPNISVLVKALLTEISDTAVQKLIKSDDMVRPSLHVDYEMDDLMYFIYHSPINAAVRMGRSKLLRTLLSDFGASPNLMDAMQWSLYHGLAIGHIRKLKSPLSLCAKSYDMEGCLEILLSAGANVNECLCHIFPHQVRTDNTFFQFNIFSFSTDSLLFILCSENPLSKAASPLQSAAKANDQVMVTRLVDAGAKVNPCHGTPALVYAVHNGNHRMAEYLLKHGADPDLWDCLGCPISPLIAAVIGSEVEIFELLLQYGADASLNVGPWWGNALVCCYIFERNNLRVMLKNIGVVFHPTTDVYIGALTETPNETLLSACLNHGANPNSVSGSEDPPLARVISYVSELPDDEDYFDYEEKIEEAMKKMKLLLEWGAVVDVNIFVSVFGWDPHNRDNAISIFLEHDRNFTSTLQTHLPLHSLKDQLGSCKDGRETHHKSISFSVLADLLTSLSMSGTAVKWVVAALQTSIAIAIEKTDEVALREILNYIATIGKRPNPPPWYRCLFGTESPALFHGFLGYSDRVKYISDVSLRMLHDLISAGFNINARCHLHDDWTILQEASMRRWYEFVKILVDGGASVNASASQEFRGKTALQAAAYSGDLELVEYLLMKGADVNGLPSRSYGATALQYAAMKGYIRIMQILVEAGADIDAPGAETEGRTAINGAAEHGRLDCLQYLLDRYEGDRAISQLCDEAAGYAQRYRQYEVVRLLEAYQRVPHA